MLVYDSAAPIRWVASSELHDPGEFLEGEELVLTIGLFAKGQSASIWESYAANLVSAGVAALGFGIGPVHEVVPQELIDACAERQLNLFMVHSEVAFATISRQMAHMLIAGGESDVSDSDGQLMMLQELGRAIAKGTPQAILRTLAAILRGTVALHAVSGLVSAGPIGVAVNEYPTKKARREVERLQKSGHRGSASIHDQQGHLVLVPLGSRGTARAYLGASFDGRLTSWQRSALNLAATLLDSARPYVPERAHDDTIDDGIGRLLLSGHHQAAQIMLATLKREDFSSAPVRAAALRHSGMENGELRHYLHRKYPQVLAFVPLEAGGADKPTKQPLCVVAASADIDQAIAALPEQLQAGIGSSVAIGQIERSWDQARSALTLTSLGQGPRDEQVTYWDKVQEVTFPQMLDGAVARELALTSLDPLITSPDMLETLRAYIGTNGSVNATAARLGIHRNTVTSRIAAIAGRLGRDLDNPSVRAHLWMCLSVLAQVN